MIEKPKQNIRYFEMETKAFQKVSNYLTELDKSVSFQKTIENLRKKFNISSEQDDNLITNKNKAVIIPPEKWKHAKNQKKLKEFEKCIKNLCLKYSLDFENWAYVLSRYVFYRGIIAITNTERYGLCQLYEDKSNKFFPVILKISPQASRRDISDFIAKQYSTSIQKIQKKYKKRSLLGKIRNRKQDLRDNFIFENSHLKYSQIKELVKEKFGVSLGYEYIGKILSRERKRRQKL